MVKTLLSRKNSRTIRAKTNYQLIFNSIRACLHFELELLLKKSIPSDTANITLYIRFREWKISTKKKKLYRMSSELHFFFQYIFLEESFEEEKQLSCENDASSVENNFLIFSSIFFFPFVGIMLSSLYHHVDARYRLFFLVPTIGSPFFHRNLNVILKL